MAADDGDHVAALRRLSGVHMRAMLNLARRYEHDPRDVEEIVADAFELAYRHIASLSQGTEGQVRSWLLRTVRHLSANHVRRAMTRNRAFDRLARDPLPFLASPEDEFFESEFAAESAATARLVAEVLDGLHPRYRTALVMSALGSSSGEIGEAIGASAGAARKQLQRAREAFRDEWNAQSRVSDSCGGRPDA